MSVKCADCGKFIGYEELLNSRHHFEPLSEFGPEVSEWTCVRCLNEARRTLPEPPETQI